MASTTELNAAMNAAFTQARLEPGRGALIEYISVLEKLLLRSMIEASFTMEEAVNSIELGITK